VQGEAPHAEEKGGSDLELRAVTEEDESGPQHELEHDADSLEVQVVKREEEPG